MPLERIHRFSIVPFRLFLMYIVMTMAVMGLKVAAMTSPGTKMLPRYVPHGPLWRSALNPMGGRFLVSTPTIVRTRLASEGSGLRWRKSLLKLSLRDGLRSFTSRPLGISGAKEEDVEMVPTDELEQYIDDSEGKDSIDLPKGATDGFYIVKIYKTVSDDFDFEKIRSLVDVEDIDRLELTPQNISVHMALMMVDEQEFPSRSRARKACRKANIMIHRGPLAIDIETGKEIFDSSKCLRARVGDRVFPGGRIGRFLCSSTSMDWSDTTSVAY